MKVTVRSLEDRMFHLEIDPVLTVEKLKVKICEVNGVQPQFQRILFSGKHLKEGQTLAESGIKEDSVLHLVVRSRGGTGKLLLKNIITMLVVNCWV